MKSVAIFSVTLILGVTAAIGGIGKTEDTLETVKEKCPTVCPQVFSGYCAPYKNGTYKEYGNSCFYAIARCQNPRLYPCDQGCSQFCSTDTTYNCKPL